MGFAGDMWTPSFTKRSPKDEAERTRGRSLVLLPLADRRPERSVGVSCSTSEGLTGLGSLKWNPR